eukprot:CAMPEP_0119333470 /NCGR_PEP_ID=MMETSP1333-20130426/85242_1 /TAXON_ID=418940 /ORGANISM="Scyphosphaera apsteinii, Strain RCC1455" /LENGTH=115 /DNA_ID=CAMNT_0007343547 /DNA_START=418 /DNA_END=762 /DNA_ORIENTATION=+
MSLLQIRIGVQQSKASRRVAHDLARLGALSLFRRARHTAGSPPTDLLPSSRRHRGLCRALMADDEPTPLGTPVGDTAADARALPGRPAYTPNVECIRRGQFATTCGLRHSPHHRR